jgi:general secretion pathway protein G
MFALCAVALLCSIAIPSYRSTVERQQVSRAIVDLGRIAQQLERYKTINDFRLPMTLADLGTIPKDPWGNDYRYLNFADDIPGIKGKIRKDHNLHPLNSAFDLYSAGPDGESRAPLTAKASHDDIIYGRDGGFIGIATEF